MYGGICCRYQQGRLSVPARVIGPLDPDFVLVRPLPTLERLPGRLHVRMCTDPGDTYPAGRQLPTGPAELL